MPKYLAFGSSLAYNSIDVGNIRNFGSPDATKEEVDVTDHDSTGGYREFLPGLRDGGTITVECNHNPDDLGQTAMVTDFNASGNTTRECVITLVTGASASGTVTVTFDAFVTGIPFTLPGTAAEPAVRTFSLRVAGAQTEATA
jgi:hypothetical protein